MRGPEEREHERQSGLASIEAAKLLGSFVRSHRNTCRMLGYEPVAIASGAVVAASDLIAAIVLEGMGTDEDRAAALDSIFGRIRRQVLEGADG